MHATAEDSFPGRVYGAEVTEIANSEAKQNLATYAVVANAASAGQARNVGNGDARAFHRPPAACAGAPGPMASRSVCC